ncbi:5,6-dimethylbenzimidazole synthase [Sulfitobacter sp. M57]|uniref:5,6-dimethylbenzimidazole synthase n=1 Tax=unclassified Sulfitobacter TaxID=196795 RepID=UPI0023E1E1C4|nr:MULTISPECIES: 5,6-dimethylbenzimidazole synthase [unclassified Sulfitobacter]MDF3416236.1 5,6-dimethylbenzimidazole synthase [Sulfitobacter sp. KE5]MDF3423715.1 5,6-dimethylbenzimidazole synthase [Sulfitobacter sp. KE43]MDF3434782.1 5,6-dimethylbenzimidazole synthase [Sulfitobacter sp. KE42]MDF3460421.1 5,6-dimethylbenzimidazole synthase [Sulfitobacter sp. S74]MDF3464319.1 5,6-dimethylbenzimidazole synthase [Sulfitobacter sp. Ks18]
MDTFTNEFRAGLHDLMRWRRDVREFRTDPVDEALLRQCLDTFSLAPSVGLSEPWRILRVTSPEARARAISNFEDSNAQALTGYGGDQAKLYASLKLSGMKEAPEHLAVYCDDSTEKGAGLGVASMPEMRRYSVVGAITLMWLTARSLGLGVGWVSVLDPTRLNADLDVPDGWSLVAYLCVGWPQQNTMTPELETKGWEVRAPDLHIENR